jgi:hypothetical protein
MRVLVCVAPADFRNYAEPDVMRSWGRRHG